MRKFTALLLSTVLISGALTSTVSAKNWATNTQGRDIIKALGKIHDAISKNNDLTKTDTDVQKNVTTLHAAENSAYTDKQIEAMKRLGDAEQLNESKRLADSKRIDIELKHMPAFDICMLSGLFGDNGGGGGASAAASIAASSDVRSSGNDPAVIAGGVDLLKDIVEKQRNVTANLGVSEPTLDVAGVLVNNTVDVDGNAEAIKILIDNMVDPFPEPPVSEEELSRGVGYERAAKRAIQRTRNNAGREALNMIISMREEVGPTTDAWKKYIERIAGYNRPVGDQLSELQGLDIRTLAYYAPNEEELTKRQATTNHTTLFHYMVDQMSIQNRLLYLQLELDSRRAAVETQILSVLSNGK